MQLPFKRYSKFYYMHTSLAVAYDMYAREKLKLGFKVLSQSNNSLLVDVLLVSRVKGIKRRITENILN